jgi:inner membrane protein
MENLAHTLFNVAIYKGSFERYAPRTLLLWLIGANLPDIDIIAAFWGMPTYLTHHRGITHSIIGIIITILLLTLGCWMWQRWRGQRQSFLCLFLSASIAVSSHPLLDLLNNYGVRPFLPFKGEWFYGDLAFVVDPWMWLLLGGGIFLQAGKGKERWLWGGLAFLTSGVVTISSSTPFNAKIVWWLGLIVIILLRNYYGKMGEFAPRIALVLLTVYLGGLLILQQWALSLALPYLKSEAAEVVTKFSVSPVLANPFQWQVFAQSKGFFYIGKINLGLSDVALEPLTQIPTANDDQRVKIALNTVSGRALTSFSRYLVTDVTALSNGTATVILRDGRYTQAQNRGFSCFNILVAENQMIWEKNARQAFKH